MPDQNSNVWNDASQQLWHRLTSYEWEAPQQGTDFLRRLAHEQQWELTRARRVLEEYRRFCFLSCVTGQPMTPSEAVDEVWHLHLIHTRDYWDAFCANTLQRPLHHAPTRGGRAELDKHRAQYAQTLRAYEAYFGPAPHDIWPPSHVQFAPKPAMRRVDARRYWIIPRPAFNRHRLWALGAVGLAGIVAAGQAAALPVNPFDWDGPSFLGLYVLLMIAALVISLMLRRRARDTGVRAAQPATPYEWAYLAGGPSRCVDAGVAQLMADQVVDWDPSLRALKVVKRRVELDPPLDLIWRSIAANGDPNAIQRRATSQLDAVRHSLEKQGLWMNDAQANVSRWISSAPFLILLAMGLIKIVIGIQRHRSVELLVFLSIVVLVAALTTLLKRPKRTRAGDAALVRGKRSFDRQLRAPENKELGLAVALVGTAVLSGTAYAQYHQVRHPPSDSSTSSSNSDSGSGGDSGGGGCGGCGGGGD